MVAVGFEELSQEEALEFDDAMAPAAWKQAIDAWNKAPESSVPHARAWCCPSSAKTQTTRCPTGRRPLLSRAHSFDRSRGCEKELGRRFAYSVSFVADTDADRELGLSCGCQGERLMCCPGGRSWPEQILTHCPDSR
jgi:hypothetical protein